SLALILISFILPKRRAKPGVDHHTVTPISDVIRVRTGLNLSLVMILRYAGTGERGEKAERMMGGHADMSSALSTS
uniref:Uncharacterized protein n=1 Tax=Solanum lycopersicum TaxID=4081 RepID=A0A3Q7GQ77_SOLLC